MIVYISALCMYIDGVYGCYIHAYLLCIWELYTYILIVYIGAYFYACILMVCIGVIYMYIDGVYGCYLHVY